MGDVVIYDQYGVPVDLEALRVEQAAPSLSLGYRQPFDLDVVHRLTPQRLVSILLSVEVGDTQEFVALAGHMERSDAHYAGVVGKRKRAVAQHEIKVDPASESDQDQAMAQMVRDAIDRCNIRSKIIDMMDAIGKGFSVCEIIWDTSGNQWMPRTIKYRYPHFFKLSREDGETILLWDGAEWQPLNPYSFIVHRCGSSSGPTLQTGLAYLLARVYLIKNYALKFWAQYVEIYGKPFRLGKYQPSTSDSDKRSLLRMMLAIGNDAAGIVSSTTSVDFIANNSAGAGEIYERLCAYLDQQMSKAILGSTAGTDAIAGGHAVGKTHHEVELTIQQSDARELSDTLNRDFVRPIIDLNFGPQTRYPQISIVIKDPVEVAQVANAIGMLVDRGLAVSQAQVLEMLGLRAPDEGETILRPAQKTAPPNADAGAMQAVEVLTMHAAQVAREDRVDREIKNQMAGWEAMVAPALAPVQDLMRDCADMREFAARLPGVLGDQDMSAMGEALALSGFAERVRGQGGRF